MANYFQKLCLLATVLLYSTHAQIQLPSVLDSPIQDVRIECNSNDITVIIKLANQASGLQHHAFNGMIYPKGLAKNSSCLAEFVEEKGPLLYHLPLRSCNTMSTDVDDGVEYFNTVVVQPHRKLVTNQGRGYHVRCKYQTREKLVLSNFNVSQLGTTPITATAPMPSPTMKIFRGDLQAHEVAEHVKIGDPLTLAVSIEQQNIYGMRVTDCLVRDGLGWGEQPLIDSDGCPVDTEIMGAFTYNALKNVAQVTFQAHKFPYTASVYYQCNVHLCLHPSGGCDEEPTCDIHYRRRRQAEREARANSDGETASVEEGPTIEVYTGLNVNEGSDSGEDFDTDDGVEETSMSTEGLLCISKKDFAIGIAVAGLILILAVIIVVLVLLGKRRRRKGASTAGSSIYSGPYTNTAFSHTS